MKEHIIWKLHRIELCRLVDPILMAIEYKYHTHGSFPNDDQAANSRSAEDDHISKKRPTLHFILNTLMISWFMAPSDQKSTDYGG